MCTVFVNLYAVDLPGGRWVLVDTGLPKMAWYVRKAVASRYGAGARPEAIVLTHGHFDHAGNAGELAAQWGVPVYAHSLEMPYLREGESYPPADPTRGGAISFLSRFFPVQGREIGVRAFLDGGVVPWMHGWRWLATPGHTPGHVSLYREEDGVVIAGDAVATTDLDAWTSQFTWPRELSRPPTPLTPDWKSARRSIGELARLEPRVVAAGHGLPLEGEGLGTKLRSFAEQMEEPAGGRYAGKPAKYREDGSVRSVPRPVADPLPGKVVLGAVAGAVTLGVLTALRGRRRR